MAVLHPLPQSPIVPRARDPSNIPQSRARTALSDTPPLAVRPRSLQQAAGPSSRRRRRYTWPSRGVRASRTGAAYPGLHVPRRRFARARFRTSPFDFHRTVSRGSAPVVCVGLPPRRSREGSRPLTSWLRFHAERNAKSEASPPQGGAMPASRSSRRARDVSTTGWSAGADSLSRVSRRGDGGARRGHATSGGAESASCWREASR